MYSKEGVWRRGIICYFFRGDVVLEVGKIWKRGRVRLKRLIE